jgi:hypothetical protein
VRLRALDQDLAVAERNGVRPGAQLLDDGVGAVSDRDRISVPSLRAEEIAVEGVDR